MKKLVEQRKREKLEEKLARQRVREQIEQDKIARRAKFGIAAPTDGAEQQPATATAVLPHQRMPPQPAKDYAETRLQVQMHQSLCDHM